MPQSLCTLAWLPAEWRGEVMRNAAWTTDQYLVGGLGSLQHYSMHHAVVPTFDKTFLRFHKGGLLGRCNVQLHLIMLAGSASKIVRHIFAVGKCMHCGSDVTYLSTFFAKSTDVFAHNCPIEASFMIRARF